MMIDNEILFIKLTLSILMIFSMIAGVILCYFVINKDKWKNESTRRKDIKNSNQE